MVEALETRLVPYAVIGNWPYAELIRIGFVPDRTNLGGVASNLIATMNARFGSQAYWQNQFLLAAQVWAQQTNLNFALVGDDGAPIGSGPYMQGDLSRPDIRIGGYAFGNGRLAQAYATPPANNFSIAGDIQFNTAQPWVIGTAGGYDLFTVAMHEIGHAIGLAHSADYFSALYPTYVGPRAGLGADDINGIRALYSGGQGRTPDWYDTVAPNEGFATATDISSLITPAPRTALLTGRDITTTADLDYYSFKAPPNASAVTITVQSAGLSLLAPNLNVYNRYQDPMAAVSGAGQYGTTLSVRVNVKAGKRYYIRVSSADASAFGTGRYAVTLAFNSAPSPAVPLPYTFVPNGSPLQSVPAQPDVPGADEHDHEHGEGVHAFPSARAAPPPPADFIGANEPAHRSVQPDRNLIAAPDRTLDAVPMTDASPPLFRLSTGTSQVHTDPARLLVMQRVRAETGAPATSAPSRLEAEGALSPAPFAGAELVPAPRPEAPLEGPAAAEPPLSPEACDRCFHEPDWLSEPADALGEGADAALDGLAAAGLAVVLGGYWSAPRERAEERRTGRTVVRSATKELW
jgi:hypothetical protein